MATKLSALFKIPTRKVDVPTRLPVYALSSPLVTDDPYETNLNAKLDALGTLFKINGEKSSENERLILQDNRLHLQVYRTSNSFWYYDRELAAQDSKKFSDMLLNDKKARAMAEQWLEAQQLLENVVFRGIGFTEVTRMDAEGDYEESYKTETLAYFGFEVDKMPVFGPGAQLKFGFAGRDISEVAYFWRDIQGQKGEARPILTPQQAFLKLTHNGRFAKLKQQKKPAMVRFHNIGLGYYALPPGTTQRTMEPVYWISGTAESESEKHEFILYVLALAEPEDSDLLEYSAGTGVF